MCVEVTERALAHAGKEEVLLVGGVGANRRLQEMLATMCRERGARFFVPEQRYLGDNGAMIAYTGKLMLDHGISIPVGDSRILPCYRADEVEVTWREPGEGIVPRGPGARTTGTARGAEAVVTLGEERVEKRRLPKAYRVPPLDRRLIAERTRAEARLIAAARKAGVPTPIIREITADTIVMERIAGPLLKESMIPEHLREAGRMVGCLHRAGIIHGDLTTSNMVVLGDRIALIDFGLSVVSDEVESRGVDLHVLFQTLRSTRADHALLRSAFLEGYRENFPEADQVLAREQEIEKRGRYL